MGSIVDMPDYLEVFDTICMVDHFLGKLDQDFGLQEVIFVKVKANRS